MDSTSLASKDKDALVTIAKTLGIAATSKLKKSELVEAIVQAQTNHGSSNETPGGIRSRRASVVAADSIDVLANEQDSMAGSQDEAEFAPRPMSRPRRSENDASKKADSKLQSNPGRDNARFENDSEDDSNDDGTRRRRRRSRGGRDREDGYEPRNSRDNDVDPIDCAGLLEIREEGYGFLRCSGYLPQKGDAYVSVQMIRRMALRKGDLLTGSMKPAHEDDRKPTPLLRIDTVNGVDPEESRARRRFEDLTPLFPDEQLIMQLDSAPLEVTGRIIDLVSPIGKGQRGLIVSPPKAGKTTIMKSIVESIEHNNPEVHLMVLLVDERPEEVTDMKRHCQRGEVIASTFDRPPDEHTRIAELAIERAKRLVELGKDVVVILDGITRLARAYNLSAPVSGRILSGGVDSQALYPPKKFFGAARNIEEGGSLTILATALVDTGSKMDEVIFEEFKGTGNMELRLDRRVAERRIFPAIDVDTSSTRHEELLFDRQQLNSVWKLRRVLHALEGGDNGRTGAGLELLLEKLKQTKNNDEFLDEIAKNPTPGA
ncbi:MAG TPA: transcription termination factor Rho [Acidimicrobiia bacterium]|nr:transcription termination factor Rho [Acidimicrobiia bacterium]